MSQQEFKLVPLKATDEMLAAVERKGGMQARAFAYASWADMLANAPQDGVVPAAVQIVRAALQADSDLAWAWHCNLAMSFFDAGTNAPNKHQLANEGAAIFMRRCFDVDVTQFPEYRHLQDGWRLMNAAVDPSLPVTGQVWRHRKGDHYTVLGVTSVPEADKAGKFPVSVFYQGPDARRWTRTLESWNESFVMETES